MAKSNYVCGMSPEEIESQLENQFDNTSWEDIMRLIENVDFYVDMLGYGDATVESILKYVEEHNKISFKQWRVLKNYISYHERKKQIKFKYGK